MSNEGRHFEGKPTGADDNIAGRDRNKNMSAGRGKRKGSITAFGKFLDITGTLIMTVCILLCLLLTIPGLLGIKSFVVVSGSMEPSIPVGSLIYAKAVDPATLQIGDVIVFYSSDVKEADGSISDGIVPITHRVMENNIDAGEIVTKGDANNQNDMFPVAYINIVGKVLMHIPRVGYMTSLFATTAGKIAVAMFILAGYLLTALGSRMRRQ